ncbi:hypothetical protein EI94DRAFT_1696671 [Lactarius quietus]|nr:hypothetical protein EI94DRAFT_1696671 [Lactarius quietus]
MTSLTFLPSSVVTTSSAKSDDPSLVEKQVNQWSSEVYKHFKMPPTITANKSTHLSQFQGPDKIQTQALATFASVSKCMEASHCMKLALWVAESNHPFVIV